MSAACFGTAAELADADLNRLRQDIVAVLDTRDQAHLRETERAWLVYRARFCSAEYDLYAGGSGGPTARLACMEALTRHHGAELKAAYGWRLGKFGRSRRVDR